MHAGLHATLTLKIWGSTAALDRKLFGRIRPALVRVKTRDPGFIDIRELPPLNEGTGSAAAKCIKHEDKAIMPDV